MEHIYTIKVKRKFDPRDQYPSERRYSASTVFGFAWVHLALGFTAFLLACLALYNPSTVKTLVVDIPQIHRNAQNEPQIVHEKITLQLSNDTLEIATVENTIVDNDVDLSSDKSTSVDFTNDYIPSLVIAPALLALGGFVAGFAAIVASRRWYIDHSITWFFLSSVLSTVLSLTSVCIIAAWVADTSEIGMSLCDYFSDGNLFGKVHIEADTVSNSESENSTLFYVIKVPMDDLKAHKIPLLGEESNQSKTRKVLSINILIAACVELLWSLLSLKIAWSGMRSDYPDDEALNNRRNGGTMHVITEIKGNNTKHLPKNTKILPPQPDLIEHYPKNNKIKKFFQTQQENGGFFLRTNQTENGGLTVIGEKNDNFPQRESNAEYKERMMNFLNKCAASGGLDQISLSPSDIENIPYGDEEPTVIGKVLDQNGIERKLTTINWGDRHDYTVYDQNTLDLEKVLRARLQTSMQKSNEAQRELVLPDMDSLEMNDNADDNERFYRATISEHTDTDNEESKELN
ncbi:uncharacterized protein LOC143916232 [Arctopsyche grandis]|uniref:uncharacterized protein LOC143916232 n=1 Tax=Arctopsyche grandis TaxID=121162 RepID=UPI00406D8F1A